jgi:hypothetical protein
MAMGIPISICDCVLRGSSLGRTTIDILLVGEDEKDDVAYFAVLDDAAKFGLGLFHASLVARVDHEDEGMGSCRRVC